MSYILDALKRSEQQRIRGRRRSPGQGASAPSEPFYTAWIRPGQMVVIVLVLGVLLFLGARVLFRVSPPTAPVAESAAPLPPPQVEAKNPAAAPMAAPKAEAIPASSPLHAPAPSSPAVGPVQFLRSLPLDFQQRLPELVVNIHVYAVEEPSRILYINNRSYRRGDQVQDGIVVEEIVPDGVVLQFRGQRFKLPRPN